MTRSATIADGLIAGAVAAVLSGAPSTLHALATRTSPLEATLAAGTLLAPRTKSRTVLLLAAVPVHLALSIGWGLVLAAVLPRRRTVAWGTLAGLAIAALDLGVVGRRYPRIRALAPLPQILDHLAYGATVGAVLHVRRGSVVATEGAIVGVVLSRRGR
ncbi:MAG TPA: hypothetical protein VGV90_00990 [Solirubrobacteraceae bacterium]|nr:hypothetical protein [Solirubrobacteraceae bacterium]